MQPAVSSVMFCSSTLALQPAVEVSINLHKIRRSSEAERRLQSDWVPMCAGIIVFLFLIVSIVEHRRTLSSSLFEMKANSGWWICFLSSRTLSKTPQWASVWVCRFIKHWKTFSLGKTTNGECGQNTTCAGRHNITTTQSILHHSKWIYSLHSCFRQTSASWHWNLNIMVMHQTVYFSWASSCFPLPGAVVCDGDEGPLIL